jgi:Flp pilus assembly protein TadG
MIGSIRGRRPEERRGVAAVELAIVAPLLVLLLFGIVEFGSVFFVRQTMVLAARSGARQLAIQGATEEEAIALAQSCLSMASVTGATITAQNAFAGSGDDAAAREIWVQIDVPAQNALLLGDVLRLFPTGSTLSVRSTFRKEGELLTAPAS